ncbi:hypothetical protein D3C71_1902960 [compost metagenome]
MALPRFAVGPSSGLTRDSAASPQFKGRIFASAIDEAIRLNVISVLTMRPGLPMKCFPTIKMSIRFLVVLVWVNEV